MLLFPKNRPMTTSNKKKHGSSLPDIFRIEALGLGNCSGLQRSIKLVGVTINQGLALQIVPHPDIFSRR
jgi:hypothetical protein